MLKHDMDIHLLGSWDGTFLDATLEHCISDGGGKARRNGRAMMKLLLERGIDFDIQDKEMPHFDSEKQDAARRMVDMTRVPENVQALVQQAREHNRWSTFVSSRTRRSTARTPSTRRYFTGRRRTGSWSRCAI